MVTTGGEKYQKTFKDRSQSDYEKCSREEEKYTHSLEQDLI